jgi:hypothetical protein
MVETSWIQPYLEPERTIEVGVPFGEEGPPIVEDLSMAELAARQVMSANYRCRSCIATHSSPLDIYTTLRVS